MIGDLCRCKRTQSEMLRRKKQAARALIKNSSGNKALPELNRMGSITAAQRALRPQAAETAAGERTRADPSAQKRRVFRISA